jgi:hypothetical protein
MLHRPPDLSPVEHDFELLHRSMASVDDARRDVFLAKLVLLLCHEIDDKAVVRRAVAAATRDL